MNEVTLLNYEQVAGKNKLGMFKKINRSATMTDFAVLLGGPIKNGEFEMNLKIRRGGYWVKSNNFIYNCIGTYGWKDYEVSYSRANGIRTVMPFSKIKIYITNEIINKYGIKEVEYGEYPQYAANKELQIKLEKLYQNGKLSETYKTYTTDSRKYDEYAEGFLPREHIEYEFNDKKYVRVKPNSCYDGDLLILSNDERYRYYNYVWVEVSKIKWLVDEENDIALSKNILVAGIQLDKKYDYTDNFENTDIYKFLNTYFIKDIQTEEYIDISKISGTYEEVMALIEEAKRKHNAILDKSNISKTLIKHL